MTVINFPTHSTGKIDPLIQSIIQPGLDIPAEKTAPTFDPLVPTIFHEPWWLDIVTGGDYALAEVSENGETVGRLPYFLRSRLGMRYSIMPPMTHFLGPAIVEGDGNAPTRFLRRGEITHELIRKLPPASLYRYKCHRDITDTIAFQQENFLTNVQFTHEVAPAPEEVLWKNLRGKKRRKIRRAEQLLTVEIMNDPLEFWKMYDGNLKNKGLQNVCERRLCLHMIEACLSRGRGKILTARDEKKEVVAAVFFVWDETASFYFMSTRTPDSENAISLLAWEGMKDAASRNLIFDFDGLSNSSSVLFFTEFGGTISPRYVVTRSTLAGGVAMAIKDWRRDSRYFF